MPGNRKLRFDTRKNYHRKRRLHTAVTHLSEVPSELFVQLPITCYLHTEMSSVSIMYEKMRKLDNFAPGWMYQLVSGNDPSLVFLKLGPPHTTLLFTVTVSGNFTWTAKRGDHTIPHNCGMFVDLPATLRSVAGITSLLSVLDQCKLCAGSSDEDLIELATRRQGKFMDHSGNTEVAFLDASGPHQTIRHTLCEIVVPHDANDRCLQCAEHRNILHVLSKRQSSRKTLTSSSHCNHRYRSTEELVACLKEMKSKQKRSQLQIARLREKLASAIADQGRCLDTQTSTDIASIVEEESATIERTCPPDSFQAIFFRQQKDAARRSKKEMKGIRWHPLMIKWCLYLRHQSSKCYETLRKSGCITLPSQRTLRDYSNCVRETAGFSSAVDRQLLEAANIQHCKDWQKLVILIFDEMYIKEGLVYNKHTGELVGFVDLGEVNNHLLEFERQVKGETRRKPPLAKTVLSFMVRGLFTSLCFPYAQFPCEKITGGLLLHPFWKAIYRLERMTFKVLGATFDGASVNHRLVKLHRSKKSDELHKVLNIHCLGERYLYFFIDPPHLIKTTRNCWSSTNRSLWNDGSDISWQHLVDLYERDAGKASGLAMVHKLKLEHFQLTPFSKMRVDLAVQVLSQTVSNALMLRGGSEAQETAKFVSLMDNFFDILNVGNLTEGVRQRKRFKYSYKSADDWRLDWLKDTFLQYFEKWEASVEARPGFDSAQKKRMLLSEETSLGLKITAKLFIALVKMIFELPEVKKEELFFLSMKLNQDPVENYFGCQRQRGGTNENPDFAQVQQNTQAFRVINGFCRGPIRGNCRGAVDKNHAVPLSSDACRPIPRKRKTCSK